MTREPTGPDRDRVIYTIALLVGFGLLILLAMVVIG